MSVDWNIAEVFYDTGEIKFRYARKKSEDGKFWIRDGLFCEYHKNGKVISEGNYLSGKEQGIWRDYYPNGQLAAEGRYEDGKEVGKWCYWNIDGSKIDEEK